MRKHGQHSSGPCSVGIPWRHVPSWIIMTVVALAFTTRRTSIVSLFIILVLYAFLRYKGMMKKITMIGFVSVVVAIMMFYLLVSRPVDDYSLYLYSNGRFENYISALKVFLEKPLGIGYDNINIANTVGDFIPHNTVLRWLNMGGIIFASLMLFIFLWVFSVAYRKNLKADSWSMLYCLFAMNFIPDLLNARFFVLPTMLIIMSAYQKKEDLAVTAKMLPKKIQKLKGI